MKAIIVMFDSLNRHFLSTYGCNWTHTPNFARLARRAVTFDTSYVCSMPCMPARRDLHTARPNFLHRSWGPLEPFDDSVFSMLRDAGVYTHLATDHYHYFETGGATYHTAYNTWQFSRGQEGDPWMGQVRTPKPQPNAIGRNADTRGFMHRQDIVNRQFLRDEHQQPQARTFADGIDFIRRNAADDRWCLQIETFDPHEPFFSQRKYKDLFAKHYDQWRARSGAHKDWPEYDFCKDPADLNEHVRHEYASLVAMCDHYLGQVLDVMDELSLWDDTMLIVCTDHGFLLGEHECYAKIWMPFWDEIARTPFFIWDPRSRQADQRRRALVQPAIDIGPTLLDFFSLPATERMLGKSLAATIASDAPVRDAGIFGVFGGQVNVTDGRYVYMRANDPAWQGSIHEHTLMPTHMRTMFAANRFGPEMTLCEPLSFTRGAQTMKIPTQRPASKHPGCAQNLLYDTQADPRQQAPLNAPEVEATMIAHLDRLMKACDAPKEQFERLGMRR